MLVRAAGLLKNTGEHWQFAAVCACWSDVKLQQGLAHHPSLISNNGARPLLHNRAWSSRALELLMLYPLGYPLLQNLPELFCHYSWNKSLSFPCRWNNLWVITRSKETSEDSFFPLKWWKDRTEVTLSQPAQVPHEGTLLAFAVTRWLLCLLAQQPSLAAVQQDAGNCGSVLLQCFPSYRRSLTEARERLTSVSCCPHSHT